MIISQLSLRVQTTMALQLKTFRSKGILFQRATGLQTWQSKLLVTWVSKRLDCWPQQVFSQLQSENENEKISHYFTHLHVEWRTNKIKNRDKAKSEICTSSNWLRTRENKMAVHLSCPYYKAIKNNSTYYYQMLKYKKQNWRIFACVENGRIEF